MIVVNISLAFVLLRMAQAAVVIQEANTGSVCYGKLVTVKSLVQISTGLACVCEFPVSEKMRDLTSAYKDESSYQGLQRFELLPVRTKM